MPAARASAALGLLLAQAVAHMEPALDLGNVEAWHSKYTWILALAIIAAIFMGWGIGANDVANAFASSVGAKAITLRQAVLIATVMEFVGAVTMGAAVTDTVRSGIINEIFFKLNPETMQLAMFSALVGAGIWLALCSAWGHPVSTTHSIIGALLGVGLSVNPESVNGETVGLIVISWVTSPVLSGIISSVLFLLVRCFILRSENSVSRGFLFFPFLLFFTYGIFLIYVILKNPQVEIKAFATESPGYAVLIALGIALVLSAITWGVLIRFIRRQVAEVADDFFDLPVAVGKLGAEEGGGQEAAGKPDEAQVSTGGGHLWNRDVHGEIGEHTRQMHADAEKFPAKTEKLFTYLQVISASFDSLAHGANDVANAVGPLAAIWSVHELAKVESKAEVPLWVLCLGGASIVFGLFTYGYNVIRSIGVELSRITPCRGFAIEMGTAIIVLIGSNLGIPLSTTHCQVGSTVGIGMCEIRGFSRESMGKGVNWRMLAQVFGMWVATLAFAGVIASSLFTCLNAAYNPMVAPLSCGPILRVYNASDSHALRPERADMKARFASLDVDGDGQLTDSELGPFQKFDLKGKKVTEAYGRRRRRTPEWIDETDFLQFTCVDQDSLEHMFHKVCEPVCAAGYRADKQLECKISASRQDSKGNFMLATAYSGFKACSKQP